MRVSKVLPCRISIFSKDRRCLISTVKPTSHFAATGLKGSEALAVEVKRKVLTIIDESAQLQLVHNAIGPSVNSAQSGTFSKMNWYDGAEDRYQFEPNRDATIFHCPLSKNIKPKAWTVEPLAIEDPFAIAVSGCW